MTAREDCLDLWNSYHEPTQDAWREPRQLATDDVTERFIAGTFDASDDLFCVYGKTQTEYADRQVEIEGQPIMVEGVPDAGQSDPYRPVLPVVEIG